MSDKNKTCVMFYTLTYFFTGFVLMVLVLSLPMVRGLITILGFAIMMIAFSGWLMGDWLVRLAETDMFSAVLLALDATILGCAVCLLCLEKFSMLTFISVPLLIVAIIILSLTIYDNMRG